MRMRYLAALPLLLVSTLAAQAPAQGKPQGAAAQTPPSQGKPQGTTGASAPTPTTAPAKPAAPAAVRKPRPPQPAVIVVRDVSGTPLTEVQVTITGNDRQSAATDAQGTAQVALPDGSYRLRFEHEGFITLERDVAVRAARPEKIEVALSRAPIEEAPPPPPPAPEPVPAPAPEPEVPAGPATSVSISAFLDKNFIGREPLKESVLGCTPSAITRVLQLRDPLAEHSHGQVDEVLYIVAGTGSIRLGDQTLKMEPGSVTVIPRGMRHAIERSGRNPLIFLSTLAGAPCKAGSLTQP